MTIFDLLTVMVFVGPIAGANAEAKIAGAGVFGHIVATIVGLLVGFGCAWGVREAAQVMASRSKPSSGTNREWGFLVTFFAMTTANVAVFLLMFLSGFLGGLAARPLMHFLH